MLYKITWQHYLLCVAIALALWYGIVLWVYYRDEAKRLLNNVAEKAEPDEGLPDEDEPDEDLLGQPAEEYGVSTVESDDISFGFKTVSGKTDQSVDQDHLRGTIPDVMEEIKSIIETIESEQGTKEDFIDLFRVLKPKYPGIAGVQLKAINRWISESIPFELTEKELLQLWA